MRFDVLHTFISPVTGRILSTPDYVLLGDVQGVAMPSPIIIDIRLDIINLRYEVNTIEQASFIIGFPNIKLPNAQVLKSLANGYMFNNAGIVRTDSTIPIGALPNLGQGNIWIGDGEDPSRPQEQHVFDYDAPNEHFRLKIDYFPNLTQNKIWVGDESNRPIEMDYPDSGAAPADATYILQTDNGSLPHAQALDDLFVLPIGPSEILKSSPAGVISLAIADIDYATPESVADAIITAEAYTDAVAVTTLASANAYTDTVAIATLATAAAAAIAYTDAEIDDLRLNNIPADGDIDISGYKIINAGNPTNPQDLTTKIYVDSAISGVPGTIFIQLTGAVSGSGYSTSPISTTLNTTLNAVPLAVGNVNLNTHKLINVVDPTNPQDAATMNFVNTRSLSLSGGAVGTGTLTTGAIAVTSIVPSYISGFPNNTTTFLRGDGSWTNVLGGNLAVGGASPNSELQLSNTTSNRKITLSETTNNQNQIYALGVNTNLFRFQIDATTSDFVYYAATSSTASNEVFRVKGTGVVTIPTGGQLSVLPTTASTSATTGCAIFAGGVGVSGLIYASASVRMADTDIYLRAGTDVNHGLGWYGTPKLFAGANVDGPVLYGYAGGALGTTNSGAIRVFGWVSTVVSILPTTASTSTATGALVCSGGVGVAGTLNANIIAAGNGAVGTPSIAFTSDLTTGLYRIGSRNIGVTCGGTKVLDIQTSAVASISPISIGRLKGSVGASILELYGTVSSISGPHIQCITSQDNYPNFTIVPWSHDNVAISFDAYYDGTNWLSSSSNSNYQIFKSSTQLQFNYKNGISQGSAITWFTAMFINTSGGVNIHTGLDMGSTKITNLAPPAVGTDGVNKTYVDSAISGVPATIFIQLTGAVSGSGYSTSPISTTLNTTLDAVPLAVGNVNLNTHKLINVVDPTNPQDAATMNFVNTRSLSLTGGAIGSGTLTTGAIAVTSIVPSYISGYPSNTTTFLRGDGSWSNVLMGNLGIGTTTPNASLQFSNTLADRKIVLFESANNDNQVRGFGTATNILVYQVEASTVDHIFYAGSSSTTSVILVKIKGTGGLDNAGYKLTSIATPTSSTDAANKIYVDTAISGVPATIFIQLTGAVSGSGYSTSPISTTLNTTLDAVPLAVGNVNLNTHKLINVVDPTNPQDAATMNFVNTRSLSLSGGAVGTGTLTTGVISVTSLTPSALVGYPSNTTTFLRGDGSWTNVLGGNLAVGGASPNSELQLSNTTSNRKITLSETTNNQNQIYALGVNTNLFRFQIDATTSDFVYYAATSSTASNEVFRVKGTGVVTIPTGGQLSVLPTTASTSATTGCAIFAGGVGVSGLIYASASVRMANTDIYLRTGTDVNHGLGWYGSGKLFAGANVDGPVLYGNTGGVLGNTTGGGALRVLGWVSTVVSILPTTASTSTATGALVCSGGVGVAGTLNANIIAAGDGSYSAPSITFTSDLTTGLYYTGIGDIGIVCSGVKVIDIQNATVTYTAGINLSGNKITNLASPAVGTDGANKTYVDSAISGVPGTIFIQLTGAVSGSGYSTSPISTTLNTTLNAVPLAVGNVNLNTHKLINVVDPTNPQDAATMNFVNTRSLSLTGGAIGSGTLTTGAIAVTSIVPSYISGYPSNTTTFLRGDGTWTNILGGNLAVGGASPNSELQLSNTTSNRKITLSETTNNQNQIYALGVNTNLFRFQIDATTSDFVYYAATSSTASNEVFRVKGTGVVTIPTGGQLSVLPTTASTSATTGCAIFAGGVGVSGLIYASASVRMADTDIYLRAGTDVNHGLGWYGSGKIFAGANVDGPVLYGYSGGMLGTIGGGALRVLGWVSNVVTILPSTVSTGTSTGALVCAGGVGVAGTVNASVIAAGNGTVGTPSIVFTIEPTTGLYRIGLGNIGVGCGGTKVLDIQTSAVASISPISIGRLKGSVGSSILELYGTVSNVSGPHIQCITSQDNYPNFQILAWSHDNIAFNFDSYYDGSWKSSSTLGNFQIYKVGSSLQFNYVTSIAAGSTLSWNTAMLINSSGYIGINSTPSYTLDVNGTTRVLKLIGNSATPNVSAGGAGGAGAVVSTAGTELSGTFSIQTGIITGSGIIATFTISAMPSTNYGVVMTPANSATAAANLLIYITITSTTTFTLSSANSLAASTIYRWNYHIIGG